MPRDGAVDRIVLPTNETPQPIPAVEVEVSQDSEVAKVSETLKQDVSRETALKTIEIAAHDLPPEVLDVKIDELMAQARQEMAKIEKITSKVNQRQIKEGVIKANIGEVVLPEQTQKEIGTFAATVAELKGKLAGMQDIIALYEQERKQREVALLSQDDELPPPLSLDQLKQTQIGIKGRRHSSEIVQENEARARKIIDETSEHIRERGYNQLLSATLRERFKIQDRLADLSIQKNYDLNKKELDQVNQLIDQEKKKLSVNKRQLVGSFTVELKKFDDSKATEVQRVERALAGMFTNRAALHEKLEKIPNIDHPDAVAIFQELDTLEGELLKKQDDLRLLYLKEDADIVNKQYDDIEGKLHSAVEAGNQSLVANYQKELQATADRLTFIDARIKDREGSRVARSRLSATPSGVPINTAVGINQEITGNATKDQYAAFDWTKNSKDNTSAPAQALKRKGLFGGAAVALGVLGAKLAGLFGGTPQEIKKPEPAAAVNVELPESKPVFRPIEIEKQSVATIAPPDNLPVGQPELGPKITSEHVDRVLDVIHKEVKIGSPTDVRKVKKEKTKESRFDRIKNNIRKFENELTSNYKSIGELEALLTFGEDVDSVENQNLRATIQDLSHRNNRVMERIEDLKDRLKAVPKIPTIEKVFETVVADTGIDIVPYLQRNERPPQKAIDALADFSVDTLRELLAAAEAEVKALREKDDVDLNILGEKRTLFETLRAALKKSIKDEAPAKPAKENKGKIKQTAKPKAEQPAPGVPVENATNDIPNSRKISVAETTLPVNAGLREVVDKQNQLDSAYRDWISAVDMVAMMKDVHQPVSDIEKAEQEAETARIAYEALKKDMLDK